MFTLIINAYSRRTAKRSMHNAPASCTFLMSKLVNNLYDNNYVIIVIVLL